MSRPFSRKYAIASSTRRGMPYKCNRRQHGCQTRVRYCVLDGQGQKRLHGCLERMARRAKSTRLFGQQIERDTPCTHGHHTQMHTNARAHTQGVLPRPHAHLCLSAIGDGHTKKTKRKLFPRKKREKKELPIHHTHTDTLRSVLAMSATVPQ